MTSGAGVWQTLTRITLPLAWPAILSTGLLVFIRSFESFEIPALIGMPGRVYVLTTQVYQDTKLTPPDYGGASAYAVVLMAFVLLALRFYGRATRQATRFATVSGKAYRPRVMDLGPMRFATSALVVLYFLLLVVAPFALILWASVMPFYTPPGLDPLLRLTTAKNFVAILTQPSFAEAMRNTVVVGVASATAAVVLTALASWIVVKSKLRGRTILDQTAALPLVFPGIVLGLAVLQVYLRVPIPIYGTIWILAIAYVTRYIPYGMRFSNAGLLQIHQELEEAAATSGAPFWKTYRAVMLPLLAPSLLAGWIFIFLLSTKELSMTVLLAGPRSQVMSIAFFDLWNNGQVTEVAAFGVIWASALVLLTGGLYLLGRRYGIQVQS